MQIRIADIVNDSIVDGPGIRLTVFAQGCERNCKGCHNPATHLLDGGALVEVEEILSIVDKNKLLDGITLSGGEPFLQAEAMGELAGEVKKRGLSVIVYTGNTWEELMNNKENSMKLLKYTDYLIDGPFMQDLKSYELIFKGSANQRTIDVKQSLEQGIIVEHDF